MKSYELEITETVSRVIKVEAGSYEEALEKARMMYVSESIVLNETDFKGYHIELFHSEY